MILELDFLQEVQILYERSVRLNRLQHSYTNRMDTFICNYITRHGFWSNPAAVGAIMNCLPSLYYPELKRRLQKIFPVLRDRREKAGKATTLLWEYIYDYFKKNRLFTNKEALEEIFEAVPDSYVKFRIWDAHQLEKKKEKNKKKEECR